MVGLTINYKVIVFVGSYGDPPSANESQVRAVDGLA